MNTFPPVPFPLVAGEDLTEDQQQANLEHVARFILAHQEFFDMKYYHARIPGNALYLEEYKTAFTHPCETVHCIGGTAQVMGGPVAQLLPADTAGLQLLGDEAYQHFHDNNQEGLDYLRAVLKSS